MISLLFVLEFVEISRFGSVEEEWKKINGVSIINENLVPYSDHDRFNGGSILRWPSSLLEDLRHHPRYPPQQTIRQRR